MLAEWNPISEKGINITQEFKFGYNYGGQRAVLIVGLSMAILVMERLENGRKA